MGQRTLVDGETGQKIDDHEDRIASIEETLKDHASRIRELEEATGEAAEDGNAKLDDHEDRIGALEDARDSG